MDRGDLVPDDLIVAMIHEALASLSDEPILFDGFPRTVAQADVLVGELATHRRELTAVVLLDVPDQVVAERISGRREGRRDDAPKRFDGASMSTTAKRSRSSSTTARAACCGASTARTTRRPCRRGSAQRSRSVPRTMSLAGEGTRPNQAPIPLELHGRSGRIGRIGRI
jgi:hypothetical protein